jgi:Family of unknown function (DUF6489)
MKITVEVECTPIEARQFLGLPNVEPIQSAAMAQIEKRILNEMDRFSPEALLKSWFALSPLNPEQMQQLFGNVFKNVVARD